MPASKRGRPPGIERPDGLADVVPTAVGSLPPQALIFQRNPYWKVEETRRENTALMLRCDIQRFVLTLLAQQQIAASPDRDLRHFGKSLQQPGQGHFQPDVIIRHIEVT